MREFLIGMTMMLVLSLTSNTASAHSSVCSTFYTTAYIKLSQALSSRDRMDNEVLETFKFLLEIDTLRMNKTIQESLRKVVVHLERVAIASEELRQFQRSLALMCP